MRHEEIPQCPASPGPRCPESLNFPIQPADIRQLLVGDKPGGLTRAGSLRGWTARGSGAEANPLNRARRPYPATYTTCALIDGPAKYRPSVWLAIAASVSCRPYVCVSERDYRSDACAFFERRAGVGWKGIVGVEMGVRRILFD